MTGRPALIYAARGVVETPPAPLPALGHFAVREPWKDRDLTTMGNWDSLAKASTFDGGTYANKGGFHRDIPLTGPVAGEWTPANYATDLADAKAAGIDGFWCDITSAKTTDANYQRIMRTITACGVDGVVRALPWLDINGGSFNGIPGAGTSSAMTPEAVAQRVAADFMTPGNPVALFDGKWIVGGFKAEGDHTTGKIADLPYITYWTRFLAELRSIVTDHPVLFLPIVLYPTGGTTGNFAAFSAIADGIGIWGPANPANVPGLAAWAALAHSYGMEWLGPVRGAQDSRAYSATYAENQNGKLKRDMWASARANNAKYVTQATWNDYAEESQIQPSRNRGRAAVIANRYESDWFKTGTPPAISKLLVILSNRVHPSGATPTTAGLTPVTCTLDGGGVKPYNVTEAEVYSPGAGTVSVNGGAPVAVAAGRNVVTAAQVLGAKQNATATVGGVTVSVNSVDTPTATPPRPDYAQRLAYAQAP